MRAALAESDPVSDSATLAVHDTVTAACGPYRTRWRLTAACFLPKAVSSNGNARGSFWYFRVADPAMRRDSDGPALCDSEGSSLPGWA